MKISFAVKQVLKMGMQHILLPLAYECFRHRPVNKKKVILADAHHDSCPGSLELLRERLLASEELEITEWYRDFGRLGALGQLRTCLAFMKLYAGAGTVVICDNFLPVSSCRKRSGTKVIQLWHGPGAFKKFGYDAKEDIPPGYLGNVYRNYDLVTVSGPACVAPFTSAMRQPSGVVRSLGVSRMDACLDPKYREDCEKAVYETYPQARNKKILLWAPTFRGNAGAPTLPGEEEMDLLAEELGEEWMVIKSLHPHLLSYRRRTGWKQEEISGGTVLSALPTEKILPAADILITDYSSVMYDACLLRKKILMYAPDLSSFMRTRGTYLDLHEFPGKIVRDPGLLKRAVLATEKQYDTEKQERFRKAYLSACDGQATERILHFITAEHAG